MKRLLLFLCLCASDFAADGDIAGAAIESNGWILDIWLIGNSSTYTNGAFAFGFATNNVPEGSQKVQLTLTSPGYNDDGTTNQTTRTLYGMKQLRFPYPNNAYSDSTIDGSNIKIKVSLSDYVYSGDISITASILSGLYTTNAITSAAAASQAVTNNSAAAYQPVIANWSLPGWQRSIGNTLTVRAVAFQRDGMQGRPLRAAQFVAKGVTSGTLYTNWVTKPTIDYTMADYGKVIEYIGTLDLTGFTAKEKVRVDATFYPWIGTSANVLSTTDNVFSQPSPNYASQTNLCDNASSYGELHAIVDGANGSDSTGLVVTKTYWATNTVPAPFLTINGAATKVAATNNLLYSHNDLGGAFIHLTNGNWTWSGGTYNTPATWVTITKHPDATVAGVVIANSSAPKNLGSNDRVKVQSVTLNSAAAITFQDVSALWFDSDVFNDASTALIYGTTAWYVTYSTVTAIGQGLLPFSTQTTPLCLLRGSTIDLLSPTVCSCVLGCKRSLTNNITFSYIAPDYAGMSYVSFRPILAFNKFYGLSASTTEYFYPATSTNFDGGAYIQNVFEDVRGTGPALRFSGDGDQNTNTNNQLFWNNTVSGQRRNAAYNDTGSDYASRQFWSEVGNLFEDDNIKTDTFTTANGARVGNWPAVWGVGAANNWYGEVTGIGSSSFYHAEAGGQPGVNTFEGTTSLTVSTNYMAFVSRKSYDGVNRGNGNGNYMLQSQSPLITYKSQRWVLPFDIDGNCRGLFDPSGAYASAAPRKGAGFFAP